VLTHHGVVPVFEQDGAMQVEGVEPARIGEMAAYYQVVLHELSPQKASLEEAFMRLTAESVEYHAQDQAAPKQARQPARRPDQGGRPSPVRRKR
jgi:ABC-2 type transport system ATP-binding protein